jgi:hypothetical protein
MIKIFFITLSLLFSSLIFAQDKYETNVPDVYIKNLECVNGKYFKFNLVNKSNKSIYSISLHIFDNEGDPIDVKKAFFSKFPMEYIPPQTGSAKTVDVDCSNLKKFGFSVQ